LQNFLWALKNSLIQGLGTVFLCLSFGLFLARGYLYFSERLQSYLRPAIQIAYVLPSLFSILICLNLFPFFPFGHLGVVFIFFIVHLGFSVVYLAEVLQCKVGSLGLVAGIYNLKQRVFFQKIVWPMIRKDLLVLGLIIFLSCISSLAIPLMAGGGKGTNLEVYIYEKVYIEQKWGEALFLGLMQSGLLFLISSRILREKITRSRPSNFTGSYFLKSKVAAVLLISYLFIYAGSYLSKVTQLLFDLQLSQIFDQDFLSVFTHSFALFIGLSVLFIVFIVSLIYASFNSYKLSLINLFLSPSTVLVGFGLYLLMPVQFYLVDYFKVIIGFFLIFAVGLYQTYLSASLSQMKSQILLCHVYGIQFHRFLFDIFWPQAKFNIYFLLSLIYLISMNEFAMIKASGAQLQTVGTLTEMYLNSYRMNQAYLLSAFSLVTWLIVIFILRRFHVSHRKS